MSSPFVASVLVPALVAGLVTLGIEWIAKPRLEVRKERILEYARARRSLFWLLADAASIIGQIQGSIPQSARHAIRQAVGSHATKRRQDLSRIGGEVIDILPRIAERVPAPVRRATALLAGKMVVVPTSSLLNADVANEIDPLLSPITDYFGATRAVGRWYHLARVKQALTATDTGIEPPTSAASGTP